MTTFLLHVPDNIISYLLYGFLVFFQVQDLVKVDTMPINDAPAAIQPTPNKTDKFSSLNTQGYPMANYPFQSNPLQPESYSVSSISSGRPLVSQTFPPAYSSRVSNVSSIPPVPYIYGSVQSNPIFHYPHTTTYPSPLRYPIQFPPPYSSRPPSFPQGYGSMQNMNFEPCTKPLGSSIPNNNIFQTKGMGT